MAITSLAAKRETVPAHAYIGAAYDQNKLSVSPQAVHISGGFDPMAPQSLVDALTARATFPNSVVAVSATITVCPTWEDMMDVTPHESWLRPGCPLWVMQARMATSEQAYGATERRVQTVKVTDANVNDDVAEGWVERMYALADRIAGGLTVPDYLHEVCAAV